MIRPHSITVVAWIFIVAGVGGIAADLWPLLTADSTAQLARLRADGLVDISLAWGTRALAIVGGISTLRGHNWARWLLAAWMIFHAVMSLFHSVGEAAAHCVIFAPLAYLLFRRSAAPFFR
jgi:hypothetical protein